MIDTSWFSIPVHRLSKPQYLKEHERRVQRARSDYEKVQGIPFDQLPENSRVTFVESHSCPPWEVNDHVGFSRIGTSGSMALCAEVYVKRKHLPRGDSRREPGSTPRVNAHLLDFALRHSAPIQPLTQENIVRSLKGLLTWMKGELRERDKRFRLGQIPVDLDCVDFVKWFQKSTRSNGE